MCIERQLQRQKRGSNEEEKEARQRVTLISQEENEMRQYLVC